MTTLSRRRIFTTLVAAAIVAATGGCTKTRVGTTTTTTINVGKINSYINATTKSVNTVLGIVQEVPALGEYVSPAMDFLNRLNDVSGQFNAVSEGKLTVDYNDASIGTVVDSLFTLFGQLLKFIGKVVTSMLTTDPSVSTSMIKRVKLIYNALDVLIAILKAVIQPHLAQVDARMEVTVLRTLNA